MQYNAYINWECNTLKLEALHSVFVIDSNNVIAVGKKERQ
jgi:hypothetical protein